MHLRVGLGLWGLGCRLRRAYTDGKIGVENLGSIRERKQKGKRDHLVKAA